MATETVRVRNLAQFQRACARAGKETKAAVRAELKEVAEPVRAEATSRFSLIDARSAAGFRIAVRQRGVSVEQRLKRTTGQRGDYGSLQMRRGLLPALASNSDNIERGMEQAIDKIAERFEKGAA